MHSGNSSDIPTLFSPIVCAAKIIEELSYYS